MVVVDVLAGRHVMSIGYGKPGCGVRFRPGAHFAGATEIVITCKKQLEEYEEKLQFSRRLAKMCLETSLAFTEAGAWAEKFKKAFPEASGELKKLELILQKDYAEEAERLLDNPQSAETLNSDGTRAVYGRKKSGED